MTPTPIHIHPTADLAERVLLPGDPGRALRLAKALIEAPLMFNHHRGLWGYTGPALADGRALTIQSTGMGGPSAAIVISELINLGARRFIRVGTCGGLDPRLELGRLLVADEVIVDDGTSVALGAGERVRPTPRLLARLRRVAGTPAAGIEPPVDVSATPPVPTPADAPAAVGPVLSTDLFYDAEDRHAGWIGRGARAVEMEAATLLTLAARHGVEAAVLLVVSDRLGADHERIDAEALAAAEPRLGSVAVAALSAAETGQSVQQSQPT